jgi:hypothetical protein
MERKDETRKKIQLGGLVYLAELDEKLPSVILGILKSAADDLASPNGSAKLNVWKGIGNRIFAQKAKEKKSESNEI